MKEMIPREAALVASCWNRGPSFFPATRRNDMTRLARLALALSLSFPILGPAASAQCHEADLAGLDAMLGETSGNDVAVWGDTLVFGAKNKDDIGIESGGAYVFERLAGGWTQTKKLVPADLASDDFFGDGVALHADVIVVGATRSDALGMDSGAAYVFERIAGVWTETTKLLASDGAAGQELGLTVGVFGDWIGVSSHKTGAGAVYLFQRTGNTWLEAQKLTASDGASGDAFGHSFDIWEDCIVVGAQNDDDFGNLTGAAYTFERNANLWTETQKLLASDGAAGDRFGREVRVQAGRLLIGAEHDDNDIGAGYVFEQVAGVWQESAKLVANDGESGDQLARDIALWGDIVVLGAFGDDDGGSDAGATYVFEAAGGNWSQVMKIVPADSVAGDRFGRATDAYGNTLVIGAPLVDAVATNAGRTRVYSLGRSVSYCTGAANSTGSVAALALEGTASVAIDKVSLVAAPVPDKPGIVFFGPAQIQTPFGNGFRCVGGQLSRLPVQFGAGGALRVDVDLASGVGSLLVAGSTWNFQAWFRDPAAGGAQFNLSTGLQVSFCP